MSDFIEVYDNVLSESFCRDLIKQFDASQNQVDGRTGGGVDLSKKRSKDIYLNRDPAFQESLGVVLRKTAEYVDNYLDKYFFALIGPIGLTVADPETGEPVALTQDNWETAGKPRRMALMQYLFRLGEINAQKYTKGEGGYPYWHSEVFPQAEHNEALHRQMLFMFYLNDVDEGGETEFFYQDRKIKPKAGTMVIAPAFFTHTHRGNVPISNDKYILTSWVLFNRAEQIYLSK